MIALQPFPLDHGTLRTWAPLPETADELCDVAHDLGVDPSTHVYLGASATETKIKQLSDSGTLATNRIVHFATHGAVAGDLSGTAQPGLILTPPEKASDVDDGYLSAPEIATLKLDADWVILSACNTAAGDAKGAEALSGLARAFFYAGARSLLVSHWEVNSDATVKLITKAIAELKKGPKIGRANALRQSMLTMIDQGKDYEVLGAVRTRRRRRAIGRLLARGCRPRMAVFTVRNCGSRGTRRRHSVVITTQMTQYTRIEKGDVLILQAGAHGSSNCTYHRCCRQLTYCVDDHSAICRFDRNCNTVEVH